MTDSDDPVPVLDCEPHARPVEVLDLVCLLLTWGLLLGWSFFRVPLPGVNETHYLTKARFFWDPAWCSGDLFLESSNPHLVFYVTLGWLTRFLTLSQTAVVGRIAGLLVLALGWQRLGRAVTGMSWGAVAALPLFAILQVLGNWSGEWLVGGIESKVFGYGFLMLGIASWLERHLIRAGVFIGLAISFHPIVGCWGLGSLILATGYAWVCTRRRNESPATSARVPWRTLILSWGAGFLLAFPGLVPAMSTLAGSSKVDSRNADYLQFAGRLSHHLDPMQFPVEAHRYLVMQLVVWGLLFAWSAHRAETALKWRRFVLGALLIAAVGVLLSAGPRPVKEMPGWEWRISLLKFYPFRLADLVLPVAISLAGSEVILATFRISSLRRLAGVGILTAVYGVSLLVPGPDRNPARMPPDRLERWVDALTWIDKHAGPQDLIYCYDEQYAVRWYAQRPEYVNYKDCPQDAKGLLEWNRRLWLISEWNRKANLYGDGLIDSRELAELHEKTGIQWIVISRKTRVQSDPAHQNREFAVFDLRPED